MYQSANKQLKNFLICVISLTLSPQVLFLNSGCGLYLQALWQIIQFKFSHQFIKKGPDEHNLIKSSEVQGNLLYRVLGIFFIFFFSSFIANDGGLSVGPSSIWIKLASCLHGTAVRFLNRDQRFDFETASPLHMLRSMEVPQP